MAQHKNLDIFPNLRVARLESFAHTWAKYFTFIKGISLYHIPIDGFDFRVKYVMFFELSEISKTDGFNKYDEHWIEVLERPGGLISALVTTEDAFKEVYKDNPKDNFIDEWRFVTKLPEGIDEKYSWVLFSHTEKEKPTEQGKPKVFPCKSGTKWDEVEMALLPAGDKFMIKTPLGRGYYDHMDLKLYDERTRSKKPSNLWAFLFLLAKGNRFVSLDGVQDFETLSSNAKRLNKSLKQLFGIKESIYKDHCDKIGGYETKFKISQIPDDNVMVNRRSLIDEELEDPKYNNINKSSHYPEHSTFKKE